MGESRMASGFSRRNFIKGAAVLSSAGLLAGCSPNKTDVKETTEEHKTDASPDVLHSGYCAGNCSGGCFLNVHVRDGQVVRTSARDLPDTAYNRICSKGMTHIGRMYSSKRILHPMRRIGERGSGEFEQITWDEAISEICSKWKDISDTYDPQAMAWLDGSGNYSLVNGSCNFGITGHLSSYGMLMNLLGCSFIPTNVDAGMGVGQGRANGGIPCNAGLQDAKNAKTIVLWGNNPAISMPQIYHFFMDAQENGTKIVDVNPLFDTVASKSDMWVPVQASTDAALALGVLNVLFGKGWISEEAIKVQSNCPYLIKKSDGMFLRMSDMGVEPTTGEDGKPVDPIAMMDADGTVKACSECSDPKYTGISEVNGIEVETVYDNAMAAIGKYDPETASGICGVPVEQIEELARIYHEDGPVRTEVALGFNHYKNCHYGTWPQTLICMLTGNTGISGGGMGHTEEYAVQMGISNIQATFPMLDDNTPCKGVGRLITANQVKETIDNGGLQGDGIPLKGLFVACSNPMSTFTDHGYTDSWFKKLDFVVTADMYMTETCKYSDIVLPAAHWFEKEDIGFLFQTHPYICWNEASVEPQGEALPDFDIYGKIAEGMGYGKYWPKSAEDYMRMILDNDKAAAVGISVDKLKEAGALPLRAGDFVSDTSVTGLENGRVYLYNETITPAYNSGQTVDLSLERSLQYVENSEIGPNSELRKKYPFHLMSEKMRTHTHSQWSDCELVKEFEPEPIVRINPEDAAEYGIQHGDYVRLYNDRGSVVMLAHINAGLPRKTMTSGRSWNAEDFKEGTFASLSSHEFNQVAANQAFNDVVVAVEKA